MSLRLSQSIAILLQNNLTVSTPAARSSYVMSLVSWIDRLFHLPYLCRNLLCRATSSKHFRAQGVALRLGGILTLSHVPSPTLKTLEWLVAPHPPPTPPTTTTRVLLQVATWSISVCLLICEHHKMKSWMRVKLALHGDEASVANSI